MSCEPKLLWEHSRAVFELYLPAERALCSDLALMAEFGGLMTELAARGQQVRLGVLNIRSSGQPSLECVPCPALPALP